MVIFLLAYLATFSGQLYFRRSYFFVTFRVTALTQELLFQSSYFFRTAAFLRSSVFEKVISLQLVIYSEYLIFRSETSTEHPLLENGKFFRSVTFWNSHFLAEELRRIKISTEELLFRSRYFCV